MSEHTDETRKAENTKKRRIEELVRAWRDRARELKQIPAIGLHPSQQAEHWERGATCKILETCANELEQRLLEP